MISRGPSLQPEGASASGAERGEIRPAGPYVGLTPYREEDAAFFFGREAEREIITANLMASRLTILYGVSGVGKSSVLRAGVAHHLRRRSARGAGHGSAVVVFSSWRDDPIPELLSHVEESVIVSTGHAVNPPTRTGSLAIDLDAWLERLDGELFLILDQFEEYFVYHEGEEGAGTWAEEFPLLLTRADLRVNILVAIREDALAKLDRFKGRIPNLFDNYLRIDHLDIDAARQAIEMPVDKFNRIRALKPANEVRIEPALVDAVLTQVQTGQVSQTDGAIGAAVGSSNGDPARARIETPFLQMVMTRLWDEEMAAHSTMLRLATLEALGGAEHIVETHLDGALRTLSVEQQDVAASAFRYLVTPSGSKIAHTLPDLAEYAGLPVSELAPVLRELAAPAVRILRPVDPPPNQPAAPRYEIFHDVLAAPILDWRTRYENAARERRLAEEKDAAQAEASRERKRARKFRAVALALVLLVLVTMVAAAVAIELSRQARDAKTAAQKAQRDARRGFSEQFAAAAMARSSTDPISALQDSLKALDSEKTSDAEDALRASVLESHLITTFRHDRAVNSAEFNPSGTAVVTSSDDGSVRIWDPATGQEVLPAIHSVSEHFLSATFSPNGSRLLIVSAGLVSVWDPTSGQRLFMLRRGEAGPFTGAAFSPNGKRVVTAALGGPISIWDAAKGRVLLTLRGADGPIISVAFDPDGSRIATSSEDGDVGIWDARTGGPLASAHQRGSVNSVSFSPDGSRIVTAGEDGTARILDASTGTTLSKITEGVGLNSAEFSGDGALLVTAGDGGMARIWDPETSRQLLVLAGHTRPVATAAFSPDGTSVVTASADGSARVWRSDVGIRIGADRRFDLATLSADGSRVLTTDPGGRVWIWDAATGDELTSWSANTSHHGFSSAAFSPDGTRVLTLDEVGTMQLWGAVDGEPLAKRVGFATATFSSDSTRVLGASTDDGATVWDSTTGARLARIAVGAGALKGAAFSPDGRAIAAIGSDGTAQIWNVETDRRVRLLSDAPSLPQSVVYSPDGSKVLVAGALRDLEVWDANTGRVRVDIPNRDVTPGAWAFSPDGSRLVTVRSDDRVVGVWDLATGRQILVPDGGVAGFLSSNYSNDGRWILGGGTNPIARVWGAATGQSAAVFDDLRAGSIDSIALSSDGARVLTHSGSTGIVEVSRCTSCQSIESLIGVACDQIRRFDPALIVNIESCRKLETSS